MAIMILEVPHAQDVHLFARPATLLQLVLLASLIATEPLLMVSVCAQLDFIKLLILITLLPVENVMLHAPPAHFCPIFAPTVILMLIVSSDSMP